MMGVVYYANYLRCFEIGRNEYFRKEGITYKEIEATGIVIPVVEVSCKFIAPLFYDDLIFINTSIDSQVKSGLKFSYEIVRKEDARLCATGFSKHAFIDKKRNNKVIRPPDFFAKIIKNR